MASSLDIVFVHPYNRLAFQEILPFSVPAIVNRLRETYRVKGYFFSEINTETMGGARLALIDIHWYPMLKGGMELAARIKAINPDIVVAAGGLCASLFYKQLLRDSAIDYIIRGDGEIPAQLLAASVLGADSPESVPNLVSRDFESQNRYSLTAADFDANDYLNLSWFPTFEGRIRRRHTMSRGHPFAIHPFLVSMRGCPMECEGCSGALEAQHRLFQRGSLLRSAGRIKDDLATLCDTPGLGFVNSYHDFLRFSSEQDKEFILDREYNLALYYEFFDTPDKYDLDLLMSRFKGGLLSFTMDNAHGTSMRFADAQVLTERIEQVLADRRYRVRLCYLKQGLQQDAGYRAAFTKIVKATGCDIHQADWWFESYNPQPDENGRCSDLTYEHCLENADRYYLFNHLYRLLHSAHFLAPSLVGRVMHGYNRLQRIKQ